MDPYTMLITVFGGSAFFLLIVYPAISIVGNSLD